MDLLSHARQRNLLEARGARWAQGDSICGHPAPKRNESFELVPRATGGTVTQFCPSKPFTFSILFLTKRGCRDQTKSKVGCAPRRGSPWLGTTRLNPLPIAALQAWALPAASLGRRPICRWASAIITYIMVLLSMPRDANGNVEKSSSTADMTHRQPTRACCPLQSAVARINLPWNE